MILEYAKRFQKMQKNDAAKELSEEEAIESFQRLVDMVRLVYKPIPKDASEQIDTS